MAGHSHILQSERKSALRVLLNLYTTNATFRGFSEFAVIGAIVLTFIHGLQPFSMIGNAARSAVTPPKLTDQDIKTQGDITKFARRDSSMMPQLADLGLDERYFAGDAEPQRATLTEAWRAYRGKNSLKALELLATAGSDNPHVLLIRGLAMMAQPQGAALRSGVLTLEQAAGKGDVKSMAVLAVLHIIGVPGIQHDLEKGQKLILNAAAKGDVDAARVVGQGYLSGWMGSIDPTRAAKYFRFAADRDDAKAAFYLAVLYSTGRGVAKDDLEADRLTEKAAGLGNREALTFVGVRRMQAYAQGISDDPSDALKWLERAADLNEPTAMLTLSMYYTEFAARSGKADVAKGVGLLKQCVDRTAHPSCAMSYATFLDNGFGKRDVKQIYATYMIANRDGRNDKARNRIAELSKELSSQELMQIHMEANMRPMEANSNLPRFRDVASP
ncbi:tetratricopeptide repeat protein [Bradyrhizobium sp. sBnM-33]|uniref:tetratricopeptide repeat protein n=1 Tax=Bradyrhizobium sp. sBnM-33 TaxID=2831780 RepID=UPI001BCBA0C9|nr:tetratricopeptide repeat protein [Bradyrhizobium sp. sBnM-33]WOH54134.1 tetratricopeptide repeat protein [Bradyrhizobium sp. sBnM-33]